MRDVIIDTDPGIDDVLALLYALHQEDLNVKAITTVHGNVSVEQTLANTIKLFEMIDLHQSRSGQNVETGGDNIPWTIHSKPVIAKGAAMPLNISSTAGKKVYHHPFDVHGADGLGGTSTKKFSWNDDNSHPKSVASNLYTLSTLDGAGEILHQLQSSPAGTVTLIALGPLTNVALAIERDVERKVMSRVKHIYVMGGCIHHPYPGGNYTPHAEFNFYADPTAAKVVMSSGLPITLVPLDVTESCRLRYNVYEETIVPIAQKSPLPSFVSAFIEHLFSFMNQLYEDETFPISLCSQNGNRPRSRMSSMDSALNLNVTEKHNKLLDLSNEERVPVDEVGNLEYAKRSSHEKLQDLIESEKSQHSRIARSTSLAMHDPLAIGVFIDPSIIIKSVELTVDVETNELAKTKGMTLIDGRKWKKRVPVDREREEHASNTPTPPTHLVNVIFQVDSNKFFGKFMNSVFGVTWEAKKHEWIPIKSSFC